MFEFLHFYYRFLLIAILGVSGLVPVLKGWKFRPWMLASYYLFRLVVVYHLMKHGMIGNDIRGWLEHGVRIVGGEMPGIDFISPYGIGFNGMLGLCSWIHPSTFSIAIGFAMVEFAGVVLFWIAMKRIVTEELQSKVLWLYVTSPLVMLNCGWDVQDEGVLLFFISLCVLLVVTKKFSVIPYVAVLGVLSTKLLSLIYFAPFFLTLSIRESVKFGVLLAVVWSLEFFLGISPFDLRFERLAGGFDQIAGMITSNNLWYLIDAVHHFEQLWICDVVFVAVYWLLLVFMLTWNGNDTARILPRMLGISGVCFMLFFKMTPPCYCLPLCLPFSLVLVQERNWKVFVLLYVLATILMMRDFWKALFPDCGLFVVSLLLVPMMCMTLIIMIRKSCLTEGGSMKGIPKAVVAFISGRSRGDR